MGTATLMAIVAHPDDEAYSIGGTLLKYASQGVNIHIVIATDGAAGSIDPGLEYPQDNLADIRRKEMEASAQIIGARLHWLNYRDSGMQGDPDNRNPLALINADKRKATEQIENLILEFGPQIVITHDENGGYFHPDHIYCYEIVTAAAEHLSSIGSSKAPKQLYFNVLPKWWVMIYALGMLLSGKNPKKWGRGRDVDVTKAGTASHKIDAKIDIRAYWQSKRDICAQHLSQGGDNYVYFNRSIPVWLQKLIFGVEFFVRAYPANPVNKKAVSDLFDQ